MNSRIVILLKKKSQLKVQPGLQVILATKAINPILQFIAQVFRGRSRFHAVITMTHLASGTVFRLWNHPSFLHFEVKPQ